MVTFAYILAWLSVLAGILQGIDIYQQDKLGRNQYLPLGIMAVSDLVLCVSEVFFFSFGLYYMFWVYGG